jgi:hypothetical protein
LQSSIRWAKHPAFRCLFIKKTFKRFGGCLIEKRNIWPLIWHSNLNTVLFWRILLYMKRCCEKNLLVGSRWSSCDEYYKHFDQDLSRWHGTHSTIMDWGWKHVDTTDCHFVTTQTERADKRWYASRVLPALHAWTGFFIQKAIGVGFARVCKHRPGTCQRLLKDQLSRLSYREASKSLIKGWKM